MRDRLHNEIGSFGSELTRSEEESLERHQTLWDTATFPRRKSLARHKSLARGEIVRFSPESNRRCLMVEVQEQNLSEMHETR